MLKKIIAFTCFTLLISSCNVEINQNDQIIYTENLEQYGCYNTPYSIYVSDISFYKNHFTVITNRIDYLTDVIGSCNYHAIDFSKNDLIIGEVFTNYNITGINYTYSKNRYNEYTLQVDLLENRKGIGRNVTYHAIVPKLHPSDVVFVDIRSIYPY